MTTKTVANINQYSGSSVNPLEHPEQLYELYSVPSFETGYPEIVKGKDIGSTKITVEEGDVLVCKINPRINRVWVVKHNTEYPLLASSEWIVVRNKNIDSNYLKWYFSSPTFRTLLNSQVAGIGGSLTRAQPKQVAKYSVPVPSRSEQQQVSENLDKVNELIALRKEQLAKLDQLVKSRFIELFGDPIVNPKNWEKMKLVDVCTKLTDGTHFSPESYPEGEYRYVTAKNIKIDGFDFSNITYVPKSVHDEIYARCNPEYGDVLYIKDGVTTGIAMVNTLHEPFTMLSSVALLKQNRKLLEGAYLCGVLNNQNMYDAIRKDMGGAAITRLTIVKLKNIQIPVPPLELQTQFATFVEQTDKSKLVIQQSLDKLETLKKSLMQEYFG